jgi:ABC-type transport system involved in cytochrome c biogenesis permease subunit
MYMSWGIVLVTLAFEIFWQIPWIRLIGVMLALMALGVSSLTDSAIKPLVPALKSWWIMIHVISASIAYAAGSIAAFICLLALIKDQERVVKEKLLGWAMVFFGLLTIFLGGGEGLIFKHAYFVKVLARAGEQVVSAINLAGEQKSSLLMPMPGVGPMLLFTAVFNLNFGVLILLFNKIKKYSSLLFLISFLLSVVSCLLMLTHDVMQTKILLNPSVRAHLSPSGPYFIGFKSHPWSFFLLLILMAIQGFLCIFSMQPQKLRNSLPKIEALEYSSYKAICLSFFLMTVVLITGALWAHYAWGRYWAWDPKETGALAIWLNYAIYLHTKRTKGLSGPFSCCVGIAGFFIIIIGFLGVNLGLFAQGLHTYGNN